nr:dihydropyrimidine dehydrogenase [Eubacteriales bacterium]
MEKIPRTVMAEDPAEVRKNDFEPFIHGYTKEEAVKEAGRCLNCVNARCRNACPIHNEIPYIMEAVAKEDFAEAYALLCENTVLPAICGTVCPHEDQCEGSCINGIKGEAVCIGGVERFVAEWAEKEGLTK